MADLTRIVPIPGGVQEERMGYVTPSVSRIVRLGWDKKLRPHDYLIHLGPGVTLTLTDIEFRTLLTDMTAVLEQDA